ncbi:hypothetical protein ACFX1Z_040947 [Malus domestica]
MEKSKRRKFIKFSTKIDKLAKTEEVQAKKQQENPKDYLEDYTSTTWMIHDYLVAIPSAVAAPSAATPSGVLPHVAPAWASVSPTTSLMKASKVNVNKSFGEMNKVSKSLPENSKSDGHPKRWST